MVALHTLLTLSGVNPVLVVQLWSQVMYWTACKCVDKIATEKTDDVRHLGETFNRVLTRKKYLCRCVFHSYID